MTLKSVIVALLASGAGIVTGWATVGFAGLPVGNVDPGEAAGQEFVVASASMTAGGGGIVTGSIPQPRAAVEVAPPGPPRMRLDASLFDPRLVLPPPRAVAAPQPAEAAVPAEEPAEAMPEEVPAQEAAIPWPRQRPAAAAPVVAARPATREAPPRDTFRGPFTEAHIERIRQRLNLTQEQMQYWPSVEAALRTVARHHRERGPDAPMSRTETQELYWAAGPLVMRLRPEQKEEARRMARMLGLATVASLI